MELPQEASISTTFFDNKFVLKKPDNVTMNLSSWIPKCLSTSRIWSKGYCLKIEGYGEVSRFVLLSSFELHSVILGYKRLLQKSPSFFQKHFQHHYLTSICIMKGMKRTLIPVEYSWYFLNLSKVFAVFLFHNEWSNTQLLHLYQYHVKSIDWLPKRLHKNYGIYKNIM